MKALKTENLLHCCTFRDLVAELPFILMHPKPEEEPPLPITAHQSPSHETGSKEDGDDVAVDTNLIQLDTWVLWLAEFNSSDCAYYADECLNGMHGLFICLKNFNISYKHLCEWSRNKSFIFLLSEHMEISPILSMQRIPKFIIVVSVLRTRKGSSMYLTDMLSALFGTEGLVYCKN